MDKTLESAKGNPSVQGVTRRLLLDLDELPKELRVVALNEQPKDDVPPPRHFCIDLCFHQQDMEALKEQYKVLGSPSVAASDGVHLKNLGFDNSCATFMCIGGRKVNFPGKSLYTLGRSWFKEGFTKKDKALDADRIISLSKGDKEKEKINDDDKDALAAKRLLRDFVMQAKTRASIAKKKGKKVQKEVRLAPTPTRAKEVRLGPNPANKVQKKVRFAPTPAPHRGKGIRTKRFVPKMRSLKEIMANTKRMPDIFE